MKYLKFVVLVFVLILVGCSNNQTLEPVVNNATDCSVVGDVSWYEAGMGVTENSAHQGIELYALVIEGRSSVVYRRTDGGGVHTSIWWWNGESLEYGQENPYKNLEFTNPVWSPDAQSFAFLVQNTELKASTVWFVPWDLSQDPCKWGY